MPIHGKKDVKMLTDYRHRIPMFLRGKKMVNFKSGGFTLLNTSIGLLSIPPPPIF